MARDPGRRLGGATSHPANPVAPKGAALVQRPYAWAISTRSAMGRDPTFSVYFNLDTTGITPPHFLAQYDHARVPVRCSADDRVAWPHIVRRVEGSRARTYASSKIDLEVDEVARLTLSRSLVEPRDKACPPDD